MGRITRPDFDDLSRSSESVYEYLSEKSNDVPADVSHELVDTYQDLCSTTGNSPPFRHDMTTDLAQHMQDLQHTVHLGTPLDDFVAAAVPSPLRPALTTSVQFNISRRSSMISRNSNQSLSSLSVRRRTSQRSVSARFRKSDSVIDPDTPNKRYSSASNTPTSLNYERFQDSNDETWPMTPTRDPKRISRASRPTQMEAAFEGTEPQNATEDSASAEPEDMVSEEISRRHLRGVQAAYQQYQADKASRRSTSSTIDNNSMGSNHRPMRSENRAASLPIATTTTTTTTPTQEKKDDASDYPDGYVQDHTHFETTSNFSAQIKQDYIDCQGMMMNTAPTPSGFYASDRWLQRHSAPAQHQAQTPLDFLYPQSNTLPSNHGQHPSPGWHPYPGPSVPFNHQAVPSSNFSDYGDTRTPPAPKRSSSTLLRYAAKVAGKPPKAVVEKRQKKAAAQAAAAAQAETGSLMGSLGDMTESSMRRRGSFKWKDRGVGMFRKKE